VWTQRRKLGDSPDEQTLADLAASAQAAIVDVLVAKCKRAIEQTGLGRLVVAGGVGANRRLREQLQRACRPSGTRLHFPELALCTDNGAMIALAAAMRLQRGAGSCDDGYGFNVRPRWPLQELRSPH
jgi:N6-L-threonylcarbamoyladenine synthase